MNELNRLKRQARVLNCVEDNHMQNNSPVGVRTVMSDFLSRYKPIDDMDDLELYLFIKNEIINLREKNVNTTTQAFNHYANFVIDESELAE